MGQLKHRSNIAFLNPSGQPRPDFADGYVMTAYAVGGIVSATTSATTVQLRPGHGFKVGDKGLIDPGTDNRFTGAVTAATATQVTFPATTPVVIGQRIVNLGSDSGVSSPSYDASPLKIYQDPDGALPLISATITLGSGGDYEYYYAGDGACWELFRDPTQLNPSGVIPGWSSDSGRINVVDYGAQPGETASSHLAIIAALQAVPASGGNVWFPPGDYELSGSVHVERGNLCVEFAEGARLRIDGTSVYAMEIDGEEPGGIESVTVINFQAYDDDPVGHVGGEESHGLRITYCDGVRVIGGKIEDIGDESVELTKCSRFMIEGVDILGGCNQSSGAGAISLNNSVGGSIVAPTIKDTQNGSAIRIEVTSPPASGTSDRIDIIAADIDTVLNTKASSNQADGTGIAITPGNRSVANIRIIGGTVKDAAKMGVTLNPTGGATGVAFSAIGLHVTGGGASAATGGGIFRGAINVAEGATKGSIVGCVVTDWGVDATAHHGIRVAEDGFAIDSNHVSGVPGFGIWIDGDGSSGNTIIGNDCQDGIRPNIEDVCHGNRVSADAIQDLALNSTTPSVSAGRMFTTNATISTTDITNFQHGTKGQEIVIVWTETNTVLKISTSANLSGNGGSDIVGAVGDVARCIFDGTTWHCAHEAA